MSTGLGQLRQLQQLRRAVPRTRNVLAGRQRLRRVQEQQVPAPHGAGHTSTTTTARTPAQSSAATPAA